MDKRIDFPPTISHEQALALAAQTRSVAQDALKAAVAVSYRVNDKNIERMAKAEGALYAAIDRLAAMLAVSGGGAKRHLPTDEEVRLYFAKRPARADTAEPVFHLRSYGDVTEEQLLKLTAPQNETAELSDEVPTVMGLMELAANLARAHDGSNASDLPEREWQALRNYANRLATPSEAQAETESERETGPSL